MKGLRRQTISFDKIKTSLGLITALVFPTIGAHAQGTAPISPVDGPQVTTIADAVLKPSLISTFRTSSLSYIHEINYDIINSPKNQHSVSVFAQKNGESKEDYEVRKLLIEKLAFVYEADIREALKSRDSNKPSQSKQDLMMGLARIVINQKLPQLERQDALKDLLLLSFADIKAPSQYVLKLVINYSDTPTQEKAIRNESLLCAGDGYGTVCENAKGFILHTDKTVQTILASLDTEGVAVVASSARRYGNNIFAQCIERVNSNPRFASNNSPG